MIKRYTKVIQEKKLKTSQFLVKNVKNKRINHENTALLRMEGNGSNKGSDNNDNIK